MRARRFHRAYTLVEVLVSALVLTALLFVICDAVAHTLQIEALDAGRASAGRAALALGSRLSEEARSSTAVFVPAADVLGASNEASSAHEVDFFRRLSAGGDAYVAYRFDAAAGTVTRYEYRRASKTAAIVHQDLVASGVISFSAARVPAASLDDVVGAASVRRVTVYYGSREVAGGNDVVRVVFATQGAAGVPARTVEVHLAAKAAPSNYAVVVPAGAPATPAPPVRVVNFAIVPRALLPQLSHPHGPWHSGDPGADDGAAHWVATFGSAQFMGNEGVDGAGGTWFELSAAYDTIGSGVYTLKDENGQPVTVAISCNAGPCPAFLPVPVGIPQISPPGGVVFATAH